MIVSDIQWRYINLDRRVDRLVLVREEMRKAGIHGDRFPGVVASPSFRHVTAFENWRHGAIGCYLAHRELIKEHRGSKRVLGVLEDDITICEDFQARLAYVARFMVWPWDLFFLSSCYHCNPPYWHKDDLGRDFQQTETKHIHRLYGAFGTHGYLVNPRSIPKILDIMDRYLAQSTAIDHLFILAGKELDWYGFTPGAIFQRNGFSDILHEEHDFADFYRTCGPYVFCNRLSDFDYDGYNWAEGRL